MGVDDGGSLIYPQTGCIDAYIAALMSLEDMEMDSIRLDPERPSLDARNLDALIDLWLKDRRRRLSAKTAAGYEEKIKYFREWWQVNGVTVNWQLTEDVLLDFNAHLSARISRFGEPLGYHTRHDCLRRLRQMFIWAHGKGYISNDYSYLIPQPEGEAKLRVAAPLDCLRRLIEATAQSPYPTRDRAILAVLLGTGVRRAECASVNVEWVRIDADGSGELQVVAKRVKNRNVHQRRVAFDAATGNHIAAQLDSMVGNHGPLFPSRRGQRLTPIGVYRVVKKLIDLAGLSDQIQGPHDLRRYFATYYSRNRRGENYGHLLSKQLGHSNYRMTTNYSLQDIDDVREVIISPFALLEADGR
jgi:site-specific recombinase XerD